MTHLMERALLPLLSLASFALHADTLVHFDFTGNTGSEASVPPTATAPAVSPFANLTRTSNLTGTAAANGFSVKPVANVTATLANSVSNNRYVGFAFTVNSGFNVSLSAIAFGWSRQNNKDRNFTVMASLDNGATGFTVADAIDTETVTTSSSGTSHSLDLSADTRLQGIAAGTTVLVRMYFHGALNQYESNELTSKNGLPGLKLIGTSELALGDEPVCVITSPLHGTVYPYGSYPVALPIEVAIEDKYGIAEVRFYENGQLIGTETVAPYTFNWNWTPQQGTNYLLEARAENTEGFVGISQTVRVDTGLDQPPTVAITSPANGASYPHGGYPASILIGANAIDDSGIALVTFRANGDVIGTASSPPYALDWAWPATQGVYRLSAEVEDDSGHTAVSSTRYIEALGKLPAGLIAYDDFQRAGVGAILGAPSGLGWGTTWRVQNDNTSVPGFNVDEAVPLSYGPLAVSTQYAVGGSGHRSCKRALNVTSDGPFAAYLADGAIGAPGTEIWASYLYRRDGSVSALCKFAFSRDTAGPLPAGEEVLRTLNQNGEWVVQHVGTTTTNLTGTACVAGETALFVVHFAFGAGTTASDHVVSVYVNPPEASLGQTPPATPTVVMNISDANFRFDGVAYYPANDASQGSVDEIRFGASYADVTPTTARPGSMVIVR